MESLCRQWEQSLRRGEENPSETLLRHVEGCPTCSDLLRSWKEMSLAAAGMKKCWDSPQLWPRISDSLSQDAGQHTRTQRSPFLPWEKIRTLSAYRQPALVGVFLIAISILGVRSFVYRSSMEIEEQKQLLTEQALREVETAEQAYIRSIERLSGMLPPMKPAPASPLSASYREKLMLMDEAIADCRYHIELNRFNTHLRRELLTLYQEKQNTLQELLKENRHVE